ncbi:MAG: hypothetical protein Kow00121_65050 [Elainellaceae cyanobacterium]
MVSLREKISIDFSKLGQFTFKIAETKSELEQAYRLVHDAYLKEGYIEPHPSGIRVSLMNALPTATTFVALQDGKVVATTSLFPDSDLGLPLDAIYKQEADQLRQMNRRIAEVGTLASAPQVRLADLSIPLGLNKIMYIYASQYLQVDDLVVTINPKHCPFYVDILLFEPIGAVKSYHSVNGNPAVLLKLRLDTAEERFYRTYEGQPNSKNLHHFFSHYHPDCIQLPNKTAPVNIWTEELMHYFFHQKTNLFRMTAQDVLNRLKAQHIFYHIRRIEQMFAQN